METQGFKRLFFDIETSPNIGYFWEAGYKKDIPYDSIIHERAIICICYKWEHSNKVYSLTWDKNQCDKKMIKDFVKIANEADELVGHNSDRFDLKWIRTRCLFHGVRMLPEYTTVDTLKISKNKFRFNSNRLDYVAKYLGVGSKNNKSGFDLWKAVLLGKNKSAINDMVTYCKNDVIILENVFKRLNEHVKQKSHVGVIEGEYRWSCPKCGGNNDIYFSKQYVTSSGVSRYQMKHGNTYHKCQHNYTISAAVYRQMLKFKHDEKLKRLK